MLTLKGRLHKAGMVKNVNVSLKFGHTLIILGLFVDFCFPDTFFALVTVAKKSLPGSFYGLSCQATPQISPGTRKEWKSPGFVSVGKWTVYSIQNTTMQRLSLDLPSIHVRSVTQVLLSHSLHRWKNWGLVKSNVSLEIKVSEWQTNLWHWSTTISRFWQATMLPFPHIPVQSFQEVSEFPVNQLHPESLLGFLEKLVVSRFFF